MVEWLFSSAVSSLSCASLPPSWPASAFGVAPFSFGECARRSGLGDGSGLVGLHMVSDIHRIQGTLGIIAGTIAVCVLGGLFVYLRRNEVKLQADAEAALPGLLKARFQPRETIAR